jgi:hypothetical protein
MIEVERGPNRQDQTCDLCQSKLSDAADGHVKLVNKAGPGQSRVTDLCDTCAIVVGVALIQASSTGPDMMRAI